MNTDISETDTETDNLLPIMITLKISEGHEWP